LGKIPSFGEEDGCYEIAVSRENSRQGSKSLNRKPSLGSINGGVLKQLASSLEDQIEYHKKQAISLDVKLKEVQKILSDLEVSSNNSD